MSSPPTDGRLRVVTLVDRLGTGGAERLAIQTTTRLDPERFDRTLCASRRFDVAMSKAHVSNALADLEAAGVRVMGLKRTSARQLWAWWPFYRFLRRERIDVLHAHKFGSNLWGTVIGRLARVPVIVAHEHTWSFEGQPLRRFGDREVIARGSSAFIAVSREDRRRMIEIEGIDPEDVMFLPNGIPAPPPPTGADVRAELGISPDAPVIGTVSVMRPQKALDVLLRATRKLVGEFPALKVLIAGEGDMREALGELTEELGIGDNVMFLGVRTDVPDVLAALDIAVSSSDFEGSPLSVMEYMEAARPVVATRVGGVPDLIDDGVHGLLVERQDPDAFAAAVARLLRDPAGAAEMGRRGQERRRAEFDIDVMVKRLEQLYTELRAKARR
ncbi:MAG TPA: glycosyltransferase [Solirubrobacterales bacterium]|nr:glycosyltransferase [Solirubrobacterales bacterium]